MVQSPCPLWPSTQMQRWGSRMHLEFAIFVGTVAAVYGGMKVIVETVYMFIGKRDLILDFDEKGKLLNRAR